MITVRERSSTTLNLEDWKAISVDLGFRDLVSRAVLSAEPDRRSRGWRLRAGAYVGRATLGGVDVEIVEKITGGFRVMASALAPRAFRFAKAPSPIATGERSDRVLGTMLLAASRTYLSGNAEALYRVDEQVGSFVSGSLDVRRTMSLRARGMKHKVAFRRPVLTDDTPLNRVVYSALGTLATRGAALALGADLASSARTLRAWFGESALSARLMTKRELLTEAEDEADVSGRPTPQREVALLALAVLQGASLADYRTADNSAPRSWFVNLEALFERYVEVQVATALQGVASVGNARAWPGRNLRPPLFTGFADRYPSNPDVVIVTGGETILIDAKYKDFDGYPEASDLHQLLAHAASCGAQRAALFYPGDVADVFTSLGRAATGCKLWAFSLDFKRPEASVQRALEIMGVLPSAKPNAA